MTALCKELHCLPRAGGLLDQDSYQVWLMSKVIKAWREKEDKDRNVPGNNGGGARKTVSRGRH